MEHLDHDDVVVSRLCRRIVMMTYRNDVVVSR